MHQMCTQAEQDVHKFRTFLDGAWKVPGGHSVLAVLTETAVFVTFFQGILMALG